MKSLYGVCLLATVALTGCGSGSDDDAPRLTSLTVHTSAHNGENLDPPFDPDVHNYTLKVQSDTYGVLFQPSTEGEGTVTSVTASITAGAYSVTDADTDVATSEEVPLAETLGNSGYMVKLSQSYAAYDVEYVQTATFKLTDPDNGESSDYVVKIVRDNDSPIRSRFGTPQVFTGADGTSIQYHIYYPPNYSSSDKSYPVVLALHGVGQRASGGQPPDMVLKRTKQATIWAQDSESSPEKEAIVIAPQANTGWAEGGSSGKLSTDGQAAYELLQSVLDTEKADRSRVYLTGLSMGGNGSLVMAANYPETFASVFVNAAFVGSARADSDADSSAFNWSGLKQHLDGRIRVVAAEDDPDVKHAAYLSLVEQLTANGINFQNKLYPSGTFFSPTAHFVWIAGYADQAAREWVFSQKR